MNTITVERRGLSTAMKIARGTLIAITAALALVVAGVAYVWFSGGDATPSAAISAPSLELQPGDTRSLYHIASTESEARFLIDEELLGEPKTVVGRTDQVAGSMIVDFDNPANSQLGQIRVNVRTLKTDNAIRDRALRGQILEADEDKYEFAEFVPVALENLPESVTTGEAFTFQVEGMLTIHGVTRNVTFDATVMPLEDGRLDITAAATVDYHDFDMTIPSAPGVANVSDEVRLEIDLLAEME